MLALTTKRLVATMCVLLAMSLTGCGGDDPEAEPDPEASTSEPAESEAPTETEEPAESEEPAEAGSVEAFCEEFSKLFESQNQVDPEAAPDEQARQAVQQLKAFAERMESVELPEDMPGDAQAGFGVLIETLANLDDDSTLEDFSEAEGSLSARERRDGNAFTEWAATNCPSPLPEQPAPSAPDAS